MQLRSHLVFLTSGQCLIFDKEGKQIDDLQAEFTNGETNTPLLKLVAEHAEKFTLAKFREWMQEMDKEDFLGLRTCIVSSVSRLYLVPN